MESLHLSTDLERITMLGAIADHVLGQLGYVLMRKENFHAQRGTLGWERLSSFPIHPRTVIDVGVAYGTPELYEAYPDAELVLVEPLNEYDDAIAQILSSRRGQRFPVAVGDEDTTLEIHVEPVNPLKSSFKTRTQTSATGDTPTRREVLVRRLDSLLDGMEIEEPIALKLDVEGFELEAIRGARRTLARAAFAIIEVSVGRRFTDGGRFAQVVNEMALCGFELYDILALARGPEGGVRHGDLLFVRAGVLD